MGRSERSHTRPLGSPLRKLPPGPKPRPSPLEALPSRVPTNGPRDELAVAPWEAPNWGERLTFKPTTGGISPDETGHPNFILLLFFVFL